MLRSLKGSISDLEYDESDMLFAYLFCDADFQLHRPAMGSFNFIGRKIPIKLRQSKYPSLILQKKCFLPCPNFIGFYGTGIGAGKWLWQHDPQFCALPIMTVGIDLAKAVFQIHGADAQGKQC